MSLTYEDGVVRSASVGHTYVLTPHEARILRRELTRAINRGGLVPLVVVPSAAKEHVVLTIDAMASDVPASRRAVARDLRTTQTCALATHADDDESLSSVELTTE